MSGRICPDCQKTTDLESCPHCGAPTFDSAHFLHREDPLIGKLVNGRYLVQEVLGAGGMGKVYVAEQVVMKRQVALKVIRVQDNHDMTAKMSVFKRFQQEALASSRLEHHNTVRVFDFGITEDGTLYIAMELLRGTTLTKIMRAGPMASGRAIRIAIQLCRSLAEAHQKGIIHRDLKPDNIMVFDTPGERDFVKLLDFGIAKITAISGESDITRTGLIMGTPAYMAPEQATAGVVGPGTDLYALGVILFEALTGHAPFTGGTPLAVLMKHVNEVVPPLVVDGFPPDVPQGLVDIVYRLLQKKPSDRPASAMELASMLESVDFAGPRFGGTAKQGSLQLSQDSVEEAGPQTSSLIPTDPLVKTEHLGQVDPVVKTKHLGQAEPVVRTEPLRQVSPVINPVPPVRTTGVESTDAIELKLRKPWRWWLPGAGMALVVLVAAVALWIAAGTSGQVDEATADAYEGVSEVAPALIAKAGDVGADSSKVADSQSPDLARNHGVAAHEAVGGNPAVLGSDTKAERATKIEHATNIEQAKEVKPVSAGPVPEIAPVVKDPLTTVKVGPKPEARRVPPKIPLPRCVRSKCPFSGDCVDKKGRRINGALFCDDLNI